jgi:hypothetical protein
MTAVVDGMKTTDLNGKVEGMNETGITTGLLGSDWLTTTNCDDGALDGIELTVTNGTVNCLE